MALVPRSRRWGDRPGVWSRHRSSPLHPVCTCPTGLTGPEDGPTIVRRFPGLTPTRGCLMIITFRQTSRLSIRGIAVSPTLAVTATRTSLVIGLLRAGSSVVDIAAASRCVSNIYRAVLTADSGAWDQPDAFRSSPSRPRRRTEFPFWRRARQRSWSNLTLEGFVTSVVAELEDPIDADFALSLDQRHLIGGHRPSTRHRPPRLGRGPQGAGPRVEGDPREAPDL